MCSSDLSGRVPGRAPEPSRSRVDDDGGDGTFRGIMIGYLGFSDEGVYMGEDLTPGEPCGPHTTSSRAGGDPRRQVVWGLHSPPPSLLRCPCT